jgi:hypothetical protein
MAPSQFSLLSSSRRVCPPPFPPSLRLTLLLPSVPDGQAAEDELLIKCTIDVPERELARIISHLKELFLSEGVSTVCQSWNQIREKVMGCDGKESEENAVMVVI